MAHDERNEPVREREREIIVTDRGDRSSGVGAVIAAIIGVIVVGLIAYMLIVGFGGDGGSDSLNVEMPDEVNVDTGGGGGDGGDTGGGG